MRIPDVADRLREMAAEHQLGELNILADALRRRPPIRRAPNSSRRMTPELRRQIRRYAAAHPGETYRQIGERFDVNVGRVSETLAGYRE